MAVLIFLHHRGKIFILTSETSGRLESSASLQLLLQQVNSTRFEQTQEQPQEQTEQ